jgi:hypothetical protein
VGLTTPHRNFALEYPIRKVQGNQMDTTDVEDVNLLGDNVDIIKNNTQTLIDASKEVDLEVN